MTTLTPQDEEHLRLLSIFHYVVAGITGLSALLPIFHLVIGILIMTGGVGDEMDSEFSEDFGPEFIGGFFVVFAAVFIALGLTLAFVTYRAGRAIAERRSRTFCLIVACLMCLSFPFGTVLGVCTIIVLAREGVRAEFEGS